MRARLTVTTNDGWVECFGISYDQGYACGSCITALVVNGMFTRHVLSCH